MQISDAMSTSNSHMGQMMDGPSWSSPSVSPSPPPPPLPPPVAARWARTEQASNECCPHCRGRMTSLPTRTTSLNSYSYKDLYCRHDVEMTPLWDLKCLVGAFLALSIATPVPEANPEPKPEAKPVANPQYLAAYAAPAVAYTSAYSAAPLAYSSYVAPSVYAGAYPYYSPYAASYVVV
ncbi:unnamed protein product [Psylliodes chrysocephalus]|uniref:Uncharacterized protein n=1 Tax=Psylliodes chrysocephalus TaxID=3402493 RepID=A0A9P0CHN4_9CUCU|nr:unnamed protein product [Psylliodes chrysocephala]